jgi:hypothetical protein
LSQCAQKQLTKHFCSKQLATNLDKRSVLGGAGNVTVPCGVQRIPSVALTRRARAHSVGSSRHELLLGFALGD